MNKQADLYKSDLPASRGAAADFSLLLSRIENSLLQGTNTERSQHILANPRLWKRLKPEQMLKWAGLCQMAGLIDEALAVYEQLNRLTPESVAAWQKHLDLLLTAGRREEGARVLAAARQYLSGSDCQHWYAAFKADTAADGDDGIDEAAAPFEQMRQRLDRIDRFLKLFAGREDTFARQWADRESGRQGYVPVRRPMTRSDVSEHLAGKKTYGIYLLDSAGKVGLSVIDADLKTDFRAASLSREDHHHFKRERGYMMQRIKETAQKAGAMPVIEFSGGKGYHFWFFFESRLDAGTAKDFIQSIKDRVMPDLRMFNLEVFPKQRSLSGKGLGNLVKLPLGIHRGTGKQSLFLECRDRSIDAQLDFLATAKPIQVNEITAAQQQAAREKITVHPRFEKWAAEYPELYALETRCPPIGQLIAACRDRHSLTQREEKVLFQTIGFLPNGRLLLHYLLSFDSDYNPHLVDYKLSRLRGTPLGCRRIHSLLEFSGEHCHLPTAGTYRHPLLHLDQWQEGQAQPQNENAKNLEQAIERLRTAIIQVERFITPKK